MLELFILFELLGGLLVRRHTPNISLAVPDKSLRDELLFFKNMFIRVADTCMNIGDRILFGPSKSQFCRLRSVTFSNFVSCVNCRVHVPTHFAGRVLHALLACRMFIPFSSSPF